MTTRDSLLRIEQAARDLLAACAAMRESLPHEASASEVERIIAFVADQYGYSFGMMQARERSAAVVEARHVGIYFAREHTLASLAMIAGIVKRDHASVVNAVASVKDRIDTDPRFAARVESIDRLLCEYRANNAKAAA